MNNEVKREWVIHDLLSISPQGKEVATQINVLYPGTVQFDEVGSEELQGAVKEPVIRSFSHGHGKEAEPTPGVLVCQLDMEG